MSNVSGNPVSTNTLVYRLRLMADAGGMITRDRKKTIIEAADRLEDLDERVSIMEDGNNLYGGDDDEEH